jgi:hypothetical protein
MPPVKRESLPETADAAIAIGVFNHRLRGDNLAFIAEMLHAVRAARGHLARRLIFTRLSGL